MSIIPFEGFNLKINSKLPSGHLLSLWLKTKVFPLIFSFTETIKIFRIRFSIEWCYYRKSSTTHWLLIRKNLKSDLTQKCCMNFLWRVKFLRFMIETSKSKDECISVLESFSVHWGWHRQITGILPINRFIELHGGGGDPWRQRGSFECEAPKRRQQHAFQCFCTPKFQQLKF